MSLILRQSTAVDVLIGPFVDAEDGVTAETELTIAQADVLLSKNGQALAQKNDDTSATHDAAGYYNCELDATDTATVGTLRLVVSESGALPVFHDFQVVEEAIYDALYADGATGLLPANTTQIEGADATTTIDERVNQQLALFDFGLLVRNELATELARIDANISSRSTLAAGAAMTLTSGERTALAAAIEAAIINELDGTAVMQAIADLIAGDMTTGDLSVQAIAAATRDAVLNRVLASNHETAGSVGKLLQFLDAAISSRSTYAGGDTSGVSTLLNRLTDEKSGYLDKLNVDGTLLHTSATIDGVDLTMLLTYLLALVAGKVVRSGPDNAPVLTLRNQADDADLVSVTLASNGGRTVS
jgi:hypothetical protein